MTPFDSAHSHQEPPDKLTLGATGLRLKGLGLSAGVLAMAASIVWGLLLGDEMKQFFHSYLFAFVYFLSFALGALFFVLIHHLVSATWSVTTRRLAEIVTGAFPVLFVLMLGLVLPLLAGNDSLYPWMNHERGRQRPHPARQGGLPQRALLRGPHADLLRRVDGAVALLHEEVGRAGRDRRRADRAAPARGGGARHDRLRADHRLGAPSIC